MALRAPCARATAWGAGGGRQGCCCGIREKNGGTKGPLTQGGGDAGRGQTFGQGGRHRRARQHKAPPDQSLPEPFPGPVEPAANLPGSPAQLPGRFFLGLALQVAEEHDRPVMLRQPVQLLVQNGEQFLVGQGKSGLRQRHGIDLRFLGPAALLAGPHPEGQAIGHGKEPAGHRFVPADRSGLAGQHQERGLEDVLGFPMAEKASGHSQDHRPMPPHQLGERRLIALDGKAFQQLAVGRFGRTAGVAAKLTDKGLQRHGHGQPPSGPSGLSTLVKTGQAPDDMTIFADWEKKGNQSPTG